MATAFDDTTTHPVAAAVAAAEAALDRVADAPIYSMTAAEAADTLAALRRLEAKTAALTMRAAAPRRGPRRRARRRRHRHRVLVGQPDPPDQAHRQPPAALAEALDRDHEPVRDAMAAGQVSEEQAVVIVRGVDALPLEHRRQAEDHLIGVAPDHDPLALKRLADHILQVVAPDIADAHELAALERQEALARRSAGSRCPTTDTGCATAASPCPRSWERC